MRRIYLRNIKKYTLVDDGDFELLNKWRWLGDRIGNTYYVKRRDYTNGPPGKMTYMHRVILNPKKGMHVDHKDRNGLNNRRNNLRECTRSQNMVNQKPQKNGSSKYLGVGWDKARGKWKAQVCKDYKHTMIGRFDTEREAALAYDKKAKELHGEFARINILQ